MQRSTIILKEVYSLGLLRLIRVMAITAVLGCALSACVTEDPYSNPAEPILEQKPKKAAKIHVELGVHELSTGEIALAKEDMDRAKVENPNLPEVYMGLAQYHMKLGDEAKARQAFAKALRLGPKDALVLNAYANYLCARGHRTQAMTNYAKAIQYAPPWCLGVVYHNRSLCEQSYGETSQAKADESRAKLLMIHHQVSN